MKKLLILISMIFLTGRTFAKESSSASSFNLYIWNKIPDMHYHRVLAEVSIPEKPNGTAVIICPGGSYHHLDILNEGKPTQKWFNRQGAVAIILRYRTANRNYHYPAQMQDIQRMIQLVRENPELFGLASADKKISLGLIGFSAGGHLVTWAGAFGKRTNELEKIGIETKVSLQPDFVIPVYPVVTMSEDIGHRWSRKSLLGKNPDEEKRKLFSMEMQIPSDMPPTYLVACHDDPVVIYENSVRLAAALKAAGTDYTFTDYPWGGHGFGMKKTSFMTTFRWNQALLDWLKERNFL